MTHSSPTTRITLTFHKDAMSLSGGEFHTTAGVDIATVGSTPCGECVGVDIRFDDNHPLPDISLTSLLSLVLPLQEGAGQSIPVDEHGTQFVVVRFAIPRHANCLDLHR